MDDYLEAFVREGEENVTDLNNALLELENDPENPEAMDAIFRTAHTLKGNFAAMGFEKASALAHAIEDLLDEMRQGRIEVTSDRMDAVFAGVDQIEACLNDIEQTGDTQRDVSDSIATVRATIEASQQPATGGDGTADAQTDDVNGAGDGESDVRAVDLFAAVDLEAVQDYDGLLHHVRVEMAESQMKGVDSMFVLDAAKDMYDVIGSNPSLAAIDDGDYGEWFDLVVATDESADSVQDTFDGFPKQTGISVTDVTDDVPEPVAAPDRDDEADDAPKAKSVGDIQSVRVDVDQLDDLHGLVEQLVTTRIKLRRSTEGANRRPEDELDELDRITSSLQHTVMDMRLVPLKKIVGKFPRLVRDLARTQEKDVNFVIEGEDVELDRTILTEISDPLMHLLRNAVDHGIEPPAVREEHGKDSTGTITLSAERDRDRVRLSVEDDGGGIDPDILRWKAVEKGIRTRHEVDEMPDAAVSDLVFHPGFSTNDEVTDVSGRGVGLDVVQDTVTRLDGTVDVSTVPGEGSTFTMTLPATVAIVNVLCVESGGEKYGIPIKTVDEISRMRPVKFVDGEEVIMYDEDTVYPLVRLGNALDVPGEPKNGTGMLVRIRRSERQVAIHCDDVHGQEEVLAKSFEGILSGIPGLSGAAVLGEGDVVTILDVATL